MGLQEKQYDKISKRASRKSKNTYDVKIGLIIPILNTKDNTLEFVSTSEKKFTYPTILFDDNDDINIEENIRNDIQNYVKIEDPRIIRPFLYHIHKQKKNIDLLYLIRLYPDLQSSSFLISSKEIFFYEYIQKALQIF